MSAADPRRALRERLLDQVVTLQLQAQTSPDAEVRAALVSAREALRRHDAETLALFESAIGRAAP